jgi:hypothetical protein
VHDHRRVGGTKAFLYHGRHSTLRRRPLETVTKSAEDADFVQRDTRDPHRC